jgi:hypothetical protein
MEGRLKKIGNEYKLYAQDNSCIATSWHSPYQRLSKKNCEAIVNGYDLDDIIEQTKQTLDDSRISSYDSFKIGFQKALEILGDKKFSEFDITKSFEYGWNQRHFGKTDEDELRVIQKIFIQSLQQTEWGVEIEMWFHGTRHKKGEWIPKLDTDGCLILRRK